MAANTSVALVKHVPAGAVPLSAFSVATAAAPTKESLKDNQILIRTLYLSCDPYMRGRISGAGDRYVASFEIGKPVDGLGVGIVEASTSASYAEGDIVTGGAFKWESRFVASASGYTKVPAESPISPANYLGVLGMPSFTAYIGTVSLCKAKAGETILVSAASGAVGQMVVQLAKARGLRVVGAAGSDDKVEFVKSIGADAAFNYKTVEDLQKAIKDAAPEGVDIYFDNVGGEFLDAALNNMKSFGRIAECGMISQYNATSSTAYHIKNLAQMINKKLTMYGYIVSDYYAKPDYQEFVKEVSALFKAGSLKYKLDEVVGLDNAPQALLDLFEGKNFGKRVIKVASEGNGRL
ncbi:NAD(P)-binding protein [Martensiomyces pterosporus]|nr:NAD(P)-binding protein [Martensiomyces pterosporus]